MPDKGKRRCFLIDGNSFCYRAYYAVRHLSNSKGQATNAIFGFITMIKKIIKDENPDMLAIAFDLKGPTFRHKRFKDYKVTRKPMPDDLISQMPYIKEIVKAYNIPIFELEGYEADDILGTLAEKAKSSNKNIETFIATSDKDALQLVGPDVKVYNPSKEGAIYGEKEVKDRFGVTPEKMPDLMALMGDTSDSIPGVPGVGEKTAIELMKDFKSLEGLLKNASKVKSQSRREKIEESKELAILSKELATIKKDVPIEIDIESLNLKGPNKEKLIEIFKELEFRSLLKDMISSERLKGTYYLTDDKKKFKSLLEDLKKSKEFAFDFETTHHDPMRAAPVGVSFTWNGKEAYYVPFNAMKGIKEEEIKKDLAAVFQNKDIKKIGQNIKYEILLLKKMGIELKGITFDTMVASYLLDPSKSKHNLNDIAIEHLGRSKRSIEELIGKGKKAITMAEVPVDKVCDYCSEDSLLTFRLRDVLKKKLEEKNLLKLFSEVEMPLIPVLADMEFVGVSIDTKYLQGLSCEMEKNIKVYEKNIYKLAKEEFNINSPKQLQVILFEKFKMPIIKRTKTGASTDEEVLRRLAEKEELPREILNYRGLAKLKSTYVDALPQLINPLTGRIHTSFNQTVTATGRLSSSSPNLQNIPIKTEMGRKIRKAFIADKKTYAILSADYSQVELRIMAHLSGDENLIEAFKKDRDVHAFTASLIYGMAESDITKEMRQAAKTVNFGIIYGMSPYGLSKDLGIDVAEANKFIEAYFTRYKRVKEYLDKKIEEAKDKGFVTTIMGRQRYIPEIHSQNVAVSNFAKRTAINTPIQGSAADLIKKAMIKINEGLSDFKAKMILQVHDELVFEVEKKILPKFSTFVKDNMENVMKLAVPIKVDIESGQDWLDMKEVSV